MLKCSVPFPGPKSLWAFRFRWSPGLLAGIVLPLATCAAGLFVFAAQYQTNDDVAIDMFAQGVGVSAEPTPFLLFSNVLYGRVLNLLYAHLPSLPWYRMVAVAIQLVSGVVIARTLLGRRPTWTNFALAVAYFLFFDLYFYCHPQFTIVAALPAVAAVILWHQRLAVHGPADRTAAILVPALALVSSLVRLETTVLVLTLAVPAILLRLNQLRRATDNTTGAATPRQNLLHAAIPLALAAVLIAGFAAYDRYTYQTTPGWKSFHEFNALRAEFNDYQHVTYSELTRPVFERTGWSENDYRMFMYWFAADSNLYSSHNVKEIVASCPPVRAPVSLKTHLTRAKALLARDELQLMLLVVLTAALFVPAGDFRWAKVALTLAVAAGVAAALVLLLKLPERICHAMLAAVAVWTLLLARSESGDSVLPPVQRWLGVAGLAALAVCLPSFFGRLQHDSAVMRTQNRELKEAIAALDPCPDQLYIAWGGSFPYEFISPVEDLGEFRNLKLLGLGCSFRSPIGSARLREFGITDLYCALFERDNVFLIATADQMDCLVEFIREHRNQRVSYSKVFETPCGLTQGRLRFFTVYRVHSVPLSFNLAAPPLFHFAPEEWMVLGPGPPPR